jgi:hypothetical protein
MIDIEYRCRRCGEIFTLQHGPENPEDHLLITLLYNIEHRKHGLAPHYPHISTTHAHFCKDGGVAYGDFAGVSPHKNKTENSNSEEEVSYSNATTTTR